MPKPSDFKRVDFSQPQDSNTGAQESAPEAPDTRFTPAWDENRQFSSKMSGDPLELAAEAEASCASFEELQGHLMNSFDTAGGRVSHPMQEGTDGGQKWPLE